MLNREQIGKLWEQLGTMGNFERIKGKRTLLEDPQNLTEWCSSGCWKH